MWLVNIDYFFHIFRLAKKILLPQSYKNCPSQESSQLDIDIVKYYDVKSEPQQVLESYKHICSCINVPNYVKILNKWSINSYGSELLAYFEPDCSQETFKPLPIEGEGSRLIFAAKPGGGFYENGETRRSKVRSFGPNVNASYFKTSCTSPKQVMQQAKENRQLRNKYEVMEKKLESLLQTKEAEKEKIMDLLSIVRDLENIQGKIDVSKDQ